MRSRIKKTKKIDRYLRRAATHMSKFAASIRRLMAEEWNKISPKRMGARLQHNAVYFLRGKNTKYKNYLLKILFA